MQTTKNLGLLKPELTDPADITALNNNWDKIDNLQEKCKRVIDADLNGLVEEGIYHCTGTITNAPENVTTCIVQVFKPTTSNAGVQIFYMGDSASVNVYRRTFGVGSENTVFTGWKKFTIGDVEVISDVDASLGGYYVKEVTDHVSVDGKKLITISGSVSNALHLIKQINVGYTIEAVVSAIVTPNGDSQDWNTYVAPSFNGGILSLTFDGNDNEIPFSYIVKLLVK